MAIMLLLFCLKISEFLIEYFRIYGQRPHYGIFKSRELKYIRSKRSLKIFQIFNFHRDNYKKSSFIIFSTDMHFNKNIIKLINLSQSVTDSATFTLCAYSLLPF